MSNTKNIKAKFYTFLSSYTYQNGNKNVEEALQLILSAVKNVADLSVEFIEEEVRLKGSLGGHEITIDYFAENNDRKVAVTFPLSEVTYTVDISDLKTFIAANKKQIN